MQYTLDEKKRIVIYLFVGILCAFFNITISLSVTVNSVTTSIGIPTVSLVGYVFLLIASVKIKNEFKHAKALFIISIIGIVCLFLPMLSMLFPIDTASLVLIESKLMNINYESFTQEYVDTFNSFTSMMGTLAGPLTLSTFINTICQEGPYLASALVLSFLLQDLNLAWNGTFDNNKIKKDGKLAFIFGCLLFSFTIIYTYLAMKIAGGITLSLNDKIVSLEMESQSYGLIALLVVLCIAAIVMLILYLIYIIKLFVDTFKTSKGFITVDESSYVSYK